MKTFRCAVALGLVLTANGCSTRSESPTIQADPGEEEVFRYVLGTDPMTGAPLYGGSHRYPGGPGQRVAIDGANRPVALHPELIGSQLTYDPEIWRGSTDWPVFPSHWWPMSKNGTAWRWQPGANPDYNDRSDRERLSPLEKYDLLAHPDQLKKVAAVEHCQYNDYVENGSNCVKVSRPALTVAGPATRWELENQGTYQAYEPEGWWGHCNGWASYVTAEPLGYPKRDVSVRFAANKIVECAAGEDCVLFKMADLEALMAELYFSDTATFSGRRCNQKPEDIEVDEFGRPLDPACQDLNAGTMHVALTGLLGRGATNLVTGELGRPAFVVDDSFDFQVWNFPLVGFEIVSASEVTESEAMNLVSGDEGTYQFNPKATRFIRIHASYTLQNAGVSPAQLLLPADQRQGSRSPGELHYVLELDDASTILGGEWIEGNVGPSSNSKRSHPDFAWMAVDPIGYGEDPDDRNGGDDNPFVSYDLVRQILLCANVPESCAAR